MDASATESSALADMLNDARSRLGELHDRVQSVSDDDSAEVFHPIDGAMCGLFHNVNNCHRFAVIHAPPTYSRYSPRSVLAACNASAIARSKVEVGDLVGDPRMIAVALQMLRDNFDLQIGGGLQISLYTGDQPRYEISITTGGELRSPLTLGGDLELSAERLHALWAAATDGGAIDVECGGLTLHLFGEGVDDPYGEQRMAEVMRAFSPVVIALRSWRTTSGAYEGPFAATAEAKSLYGNAITKSQAGVQRAIQSLN